MIFGCDEGRRSWVFIGSLVGVKMEGEDVGINGVFDFEFFVINVFGRVLKLNS